MSSNHLIKYYNDEKEKLYNEHFRGENQPLLRLVRLERCNATDDETAMRKAEEGCESERLLQALDDEPPDDGGAQVGGHHQAKGIPTLPTKDSRRGNP